MSVAAFGGVTFKLRDKEFPCTGHKLSKWTVTLLVKQLANAGSSVSQMSAQLDFILKVTEPDCHDDLLDWLEECDAEYDEVMESITACVAELSDRPLASPEEPSPGSGKTKTSPTHKVVSLSQDKAG